MKIRRLLMLAIFFWTSQNFKYLAEAVKFANSLPIETRDSAYIVHLDNVDQVLDGQNFGRYAVIHKAVQ